MNREPAGTDEGLTAALARVAALRDQLSRIELQIVVVAPPDAVRRAARERAVNAARAAGRGAVLDDTLAEIRDTTLQAFARAAFSGTWAASQMAVSVASAQDRVAAIAAFEESAIAAVTEDLVDDDTLDTLRATTDHFVSATGMPVPMVLSSLGAPRAGTVRNPLQGRGHHRGGGRAWSNIRRGAGRDRRNRVWGRHRRRARVDRAATRGVARSRHARLV